MTCAEARITLGAYVLDALDPAERAAVAAHLAACARCHAEYDELAGLPDLLATVSLTDATSAPAQPHPDLLDRLLAQVAAERAADRRRRLLSLAAAAVVLLAVGLGAFALTRPDTGAPLIARGSTSSPSPSASASPSGSPGAVEEVAATDPGTGVWAAVDQRRKAWGTALHLQLRGVPPGQSCKLLAVSTRGQAQVAASWSIPPAGTSAYRHGARTYAIDGAVGLQLPDVARYDVVTFDGRRLVSVART